jgi:hypothetical protein
MNRRDFLRLRTTKPQRERELEVSCRELHLRYLETRVSAYDDPATSAELFFRDLLREMRDVRLLKIADRDSLTDSDFRRRLGDFVASFRAAGGSVEMRGT